MRAPQMVIMRGLPGSGKSTHAAHWRPTHVALSRDGMRDMMVPSGYEGSVGAELEGVITKTLEGMARTLLGEGKDVIIDAQNLRTKEVRGWARIGYECGAAVTVEDLRHLELNEVLYRNLTRDKQVPPEYIRSQHQKFIAGREDFALESRYIIEKERENFRDQKGLTKAPPHNADLPDAWVFDLDGTLAIKHEDRDIYDASLVHMDYANEPVHTLLWDLVNAGSIMEAVGRPPVQIIFCTGRHEEFREQTEQWLNEWFHGLDYTLLMRQQKNRADWREKLDLYNEHMRGKVNVLGVFDDRDQVVRMWRELGLQCFQVAEGSF